MSVFTTLARATGLFIATALAKIVGCYLPYLCLRKSASPWLLVPAVVALSLFVWLLSLHPTSAGRTYAAYGGVYVATAVLWLWLIEGQRPDRWDVIGAGVCILGMAIIVLGPRE
jgi:small multidrug resistance family-3 protein